MFVAVGGNPPLVATSVDGEEWDLHVVQTSSRLRDVCKAGTGYCAVGQSGAVAYSADGITWTGSRIENATEIFGVTEYQGGALAVGYRRTFYSVNGFGWEVLRDDLECFPQDVIPGLGDYLVVGRSLNNSDPTPVWTTENGQELTPLEGVSGRNLRAAAFSEAARCIVAVGGDGVIIRNQLIETD